MSDNTKMPKPAPVKPAPVKPTPIKPTPVKPIKAEQYRRKKHCVRCNVEITEDTGVIRRVCSPCDLELQTMHWSIEHKLFNKPTYMPEKGDEVNEGLGHSPEWYVSNGYELTKWPLPKRRSFFRRQPVNEAMAL